MNIHKSLKRLCLMLGLCASVGSLAACDGLLGSGESKNYVDLETYLGITDIGGNEGFALIVDSVNVGVGFIQDGSYYLPYEAVREYVDSHYYWNEAEKMLTYATSKHIYDATAGTTEYTEDGVSKSHDKTIVQCVDDVAYIDKDYVTLMNASMDITMYDEPKRMILDVAREIPKEQIRKDTSLRTGPSADSDIVIDLPEDELVRVVKKENGYAYITTEEGLSGYVDESLVPIPANAVPDYYPDAWQQLEPHTYIAKDYTICLGWHQMEYEAGNDSLSSMIVGADELNVISPTWFKITDAYGGISSLASKSYVDKAHARGLEVWGLISDFNYDEDGNYYINEVVTSTTARRNLIANIIDEATACGMDGINIDFEMIRAVAAEGYVQFIRELAIECDKEEIVLSVDMYVPTASNQYYDRTAVGEVVDYLVIMGYDEHWAGCGEAGSVASLPYVTYGVLNTLAEVPASRVINAVPFYTRVWYEDTLENAPEGAVIVEDPINGDYALSSKAVGMGDAKELIEDNNGSTRWIEEQGQYYAEYYVGERLARIWLEDKESLALKLGVMKENNLAGVACWKLGLESDEAWEAIADYIK